MINLPSSLTKNLPLQEYNLNKISISTNNPKSINMQIKSNYGSPINTTPYISDSKETAGSYMQTMDFMKKMDTLSTFMAAHKEDEN